MRTLLASINTAMRIDETIGGNPVAALRVPSTKRREVAALDIEAWWRDVEEITPVRRDLHIAMMLSGARRSSLLQVRRDDVDLDRAVLMFRHMKKGGRMLFQMGKRLAERMRARVEAGLAVSNEW